MSRATSKGMHFNPRPREGSDLYPRCGQDLQDDFNPRPREGSDHGVLVDELAAIKFQSTPP